MVQTAVVPYAFRALAVDFDGTLTTGPRPDDNVLEAIRVARRSGLRVVLVTGRIMSELRVGFPDVEHWFDVVVAENGAVIAGQPGRTLLAPQIDPGLAAALTDRGVALRRGEVLLACMAADAAAITEEIHELGRDYQLLYNRSELMVLPAGVTKATGLQYALVLLGLSNHVAVAIGDAENDHALLQSCELGVAVANAVTALKERADLVLDEPDGRGVMQFLAGPVLAGTSSLRSRTRGAPIGTFDDGTPAMLPATHSNVLITGASRSGKSFVAGLYAERLIGATYTVLVVDYEGDHIGLRALPGVVVVGGEHHLPDPDEVCSLLRQFVSVVVDLSVLNHRDQDAYVASLADALGHLRASKGLPHWLVIDEAHRWPVGMDGFARSRQRGCCFATWRPDQLGPETSTLFDVAIEVSSPGERWTGTGRPCTVTVLDQLRWPEPRRVTLGGRGSRHIRHWHKYTEGDLPAQKRFEFRRTSGSLTGDVAANLGEFERSVSTVGDEVLIHHLSGHDFSRWMLDALQDASLATDLAEIEGGFAITHDVAVARSRMRASIRSRTELPAGR